MAYYHGSVEIIMQKAESNSTTDDKVLIRKNTEYDEYEITYTDYNEGTPLSHKLSGFYRQRVMEYVYTLLKNHYLDEEGYSHIQVNVPAMPRMIVSADKLKEVYYREHLYDLVGLGLDMLGNCESQKRNDCTHTSDDYTYTYTYRYDTPTPTPNARSTAPGVRPQHLFFDEDTY